MSADACGQCKKSAPWAAVRRGGQLEEVRYQAAAVVTGLSKTRMATLPHCIHTMRNIPEFDPAHLVAREEPVEARRVAEYHGLLRQRDYSAPRSLLNSWVQCLSVGLADLDTRSWAISPELLASGSAMHLMILITNDNEPALPAGCADVLALRDGLPPEGVAALAHLVALSMVGCVPTGAAMRPPAAPTCTTLVPALPVGRASSGDRAADVCVTRGGAHVGRGRVQPP